MGIERQGNTAMFRLAVGELQEEELRVLRFRATEGISQQFSVDFEIVSEDSNVQFDAVVGQSAAFVIDCGDEPRYFNGIISSFEQGAVGKRFTRYFARMVPRVWLLNHRVDSRIYQNLSVPDIVSSVLSDAGVPMDSVKGLDDLGGTYKEREFCVQYQESDWAFISRLCEEEGIFYFFDHIDEDHFLTFGDNTSVHPEIAGESAEIPYREPSGTVNESEYIGRFRLTESIRPGTVHVRDFDFTAPKVNLEGRDKASSFGDLELFEYPGEYNDAAVVKQLASVRLEEQQALRRVAGGESVCQRFCAGFRFSMVDNPRDELNAEWVMTDVVHEGFEPQALEQEQPEAGGEDEYRNEFRCIPAETVYRPSRVTPRPFVRGTQSATVVCPDGEEIYTDEYGRVKLRFHWDRRGEADENSSCWVRVSQHMAGAGWGQFWIPRSGQEVIVSFHDGNPDQPHIIGRVYNAENMPPYSLPDERTKSTIKSASTPGSDGFNELRFEDKAGEEQVFIHAQKQLDMRVGDSRFETVVKDRHLIVENDKVEHVKNERHTKVDADDASEFGKDRHVKITGKQASEVGESLSLTVSGDVIEVFKGAHSEQTTGNYYVKAAGVVIEASSGITLKCGSSSVVVDAAGVTLSGNLVVADGKTVMIASGPGSPAMSGSAGAAVAPMAAIVAEAADLADPGKMAEIKADQLAAGEGKYGAVPIKPLKRDEDDEERTWIEIELLDEEGNPVPGERYEVTMPDGETVARGTLDQNGFARIEGVDPGECQVTFPELDQDAWEPE